jgi:hypothetical protein
VNDGLKNFINNMGVLCETWTLTYKNFLSQGMDVKEAMMHTQGFMAALISATMQASGGKE